MLVSSGYARSWWRQSKECTFRRNGDFVNVFYEGDGCKKWIGLLEHDLKAFLDSGDIEGEGLISFDIPADVLTALREMLIRHSMDELREAIAAEVVK